MAGSQFLPFTDLQKLIDFPNEYYQLKILAQTWLNSYNESSVRQVLMNLHSSNSFSEAYFKLLCQLPILDNRSQLYLYYTILNGITHLQLEDFQEFFQLLQELLSSYEENYPYPLDHMADFITISIPSIMDQVNQHQLVFFQTKPNNLVYPLKLGSETSQLQSQLYIEDSSYESLLSQPLILSEMPICNVLIETSMETEMVPILQVQSGVYSEIQISKHPQNGFPPIDFIDLHIKQFPQTIQEIQQKSTHQEIELSEYARSSIVATKSEKEHEQHSPQFPLHFDKQIRNSFQQHSDNNQTKNQTQITPEKSKSEEIFLSKPTDFSVNQEIEKRVFSSNHPNHKQLLQKDNPTENLQQEGINQILPTDLISQLNQFDPTPPESCPENLIGNQQHQTTNIEQSSYPDFDNPNYQDDSQSSTSLPSYQQFSPYQQLLPHHPIQFNDQLPSRQQGQGQTNEPVSYIPILGNQPNQNQILNPDQFQEIIISPIDTTPIQPYFSKQDDSIIEIITHSIDPMSEFELPLSQPDTLYKNQTNEQQVGKHLISSQESSILFQLQPEIYCQHPTNEIVELNYQDHSFPPDPQKLDLNFFLLNFIIPSSQAMKLFERDLDHKPPSNALQSNLLFQSIKPCVGQLNNLLLPHQLKINGSAISTFLYYQSSNLNRLLDQSIMLSFCQILSFSIEFFSLLAKEPSTTTFRQVKQEKFNVKFNYSQSLIIQEFYSQLDKRIRIYSHPTHPCPLLSLVKEIYCHQTSLHPFLTLYLQKFNLIPRNCAITDYTLSRIISSFEFLTFRFHSLSDIQIEDKLKTPTDQNCYFPKEEIQHLIQVYIQLNDNQFKSYYHSFHIINSQYFLNCLLFEFQSNVKKKVIDFDLRFNKFKNKR